jgi:hypothetical protein
MSVSLLRAAGTYRVRPGFRAVREALLRNCGRKGISEALSTLVLVEVEVVGATSRPDLVNWHQSGSDQVPWDDLYTTMDRSIVIGRMHEEPSIGDYALSFYLHGFDPTKPLETPWGRIVLPPPQDERPPHLANRRYVYPT